MANWSTNLLILSGQIEEVDRFVERARGEPHRYRMDEDRTEQGPIEALCFHSLYPVPEAVLESSFQEVGCHWEVENWGVKWGCNGSQLEVISPCEVQYLFSTPWSAPTPFFEKVAADFPELRFEIKWIGYGTNSAGAAIWETGKLVEQWEREATRDEEEQVEMAWEGHPPMSLVVRNLDKE